MSAPTFDPNKATPSNYNPNPPITPPKGVAPKPSKVDEKTTTVTGQTLAHTSPSVVRDRKGSTRRSPLPDFSNMTTGLSNSTPPQTPSRAYEFARESARKAQVSAQKVKDSANKTLEVVAAEAPDRLQTPSKNSLQIVGGVDEKFVKAREHQRGNSYREAPPAMQSPARTNSTTSSLDELSSSANTNGDIAKRLDFGSSSLSTATSSSSTTTAPKAKQNNRGSLSIKGKAKTMLDAVEALMGLLKNLGSIRSDEEFKFYATNIMDLTNLYFESKESLKGARKTTRVGSVGIQGKEFAKRRLNSEDKKSAFDISMQNFLMGNLIEFTKSKHWKKFPVKTECSGLKISSQAKRLLKWVSLEKLTMQPLENLQELRKAIGNFIQLIRTQITNIKTGIDFNLWDGKTKRTAFEKREAEKLNIPLELYVLLHNLHQELAAEQPEKEEQKKEFYEVYFSKCIELLTYYAFCLDHLRENEFKDSSELNQRAFKRLSQASSKRVLVVEPKPGSSIEIPQTSRRGTISLKNPALLNYLEPLSQQIEALANLDLLDIISPKVNQVDQQMFSIKSKALAIIEALSDEEEKNFESFLSTSDIAPICYSKVRNSAEHDALVKFMESLLPYIKHPFPTRTKKASYNAASLVDWLSLKDLTKSEFVTVHQYKMIFPYLLDLMDLCIDNIRTNGTSDFDMSHAPATVISIYKKLYDLIVQYAEQSDPELKTADQLTRVKAINGALEMRLNQLRTSLRDGYIADFEDKLNLIRLEDSEIAKLEGTSTHEFERSAQMGLRTVQIAQVAKLFSEEEVDARHMKIADTLPAKSNEWEAVFGGGASLSIHGVPQNSKNITPTTIYSTEGKEIEEASRSEHLKLILDHLLDGIQVDKTIAEKVKTLAHLFLQTGIKINSEEVLKQLGLNIGENSKIEELILTLNSSKEKTITRSFECFVSVLQALILNNEEHAWCEDLIKLLVVLAFVNQQSAFTNYKAINALKIGLGSQGSFISTFKQNENGTHSLDNQQRMIYEIHFEKGGVRLVAKAFHNFNDPNGAKIALGVAPLMYQEHYQLGIDYALFTRPQDWKPNYIGSIIKTTSNKDSLKPYLRLKEMVQLILAYADIECRIEEVLK